MSDRPTTFSVVIPVYNEARTIEAVIREVQSVRLDGVKMAWTILKWRVMPFS